MEVSDWKTKQKEEIDRFFLDDKHDWEVDYFVSGMRAKLSSVLPDKMNLQPILLEEFKKLRQDANQLDVFLEMSEYLQEKITSFYEKKSSNNQDESI